MKFVKLDGKRYLVKKMYHRKGNDTLVIIPFDKKNKKLIDFVAKELAKAVNREALLKQSFRFYGI